MAPSLLFAPLWGAELGLAPQLPPAPTRIGPETRNDAVSPDDYWNSDGGVTWHQFVLHTGLAYKATYTDNTFQSAGSTGADFIHYVSPRISIERGFERATTSTLVHLAYQPSFVTYSRFSRLDRIYHTLNSSVGTSWGENTLNLAHNYSQSSESSPEVGQIANQGTHHTQLDYNTPLSGKLNLNSSIEQHLVTSDRPGASGAQSTDRWQGTTRVAFAFLPKISSGVGLSGGYTDQSTRGSRYQYFNEQFLVSFDYFPTGKIDFSVEGGFQMAQSGTVSVSNPSATPIASASLNYTPRYGTQITLNTKRTSEAAQFFLGQQITQTTASLTTKQRIYEAFSFVVNFGYFRGEYQVLDASQTSFGYNYDQAMIGADLQWRINARLNSSLFYQYIHRVSSSAIDTLSGNQIGVSVDFRY